MTHPHAPRPTDLVALVAFEGEVYANQAVTRDRLGRPQAAPHALAAAIKQWLGRGPHLWIDVRGRQIHGIATARELARHEAWELDTLVDAGGAVEGVVGALLQQAAEAAGADGVRQLLLRMPADAPALTEAIRAGFTLAAHERLWSGDPRDFAPADVHPSIAVRETEERDSYPLFQLYNRALPIDTRRALATTFEEWEALQDRRWLGRGAREYVAEVDGRISGALRASPSGQFALLVEPDGDAVAEALLAAAAPQLTGAERVLALAQDIAATPVSVLRAHGLEAGDEYVLLSQRTARTVMQTLPAQRGRVVPTRG